MIVPKRFLEGRKGPRRRCPMWSFCLQLKILTMLQHLNVAQGKLEEAMSLAKVCKM